MLIRHCRAVDDRTIKAAIHGGARGPDDVGRRCGAGSRCGGCLPALLDLLAEAGLQATDGRTCAA